jgi:hypothetical protein
VVPPKANAAANSSVAVAIPVFLKFTSMLNPSPQTSSSGVHS